MSFENERKRRMTRILELLANNPEGLSLQSIAQATNTLTEITKERLILYIEELEWAGTIVKKRDGRIKLK
jgi:predicted transcriptional regulator